MSVEEGGKGKEGAHPISSKSSTENWSQLKLNRRKLTLTSLPLTMRESGSAFISHGMLTGKELLKLRLRTRGDEARRGDCAEPVS